MKSGFNYHFIIVFFVLIHIFFINLHPVNFEHSFAEASLFIGQYDINIINNFFQHQANTIVFSIIAGIFNLILQNLDSLQITKLISSLSYIFIGYAILNFKLINTKKNNLKYLIVLIFLHPVIFIYSLRGTPDVISASIGLFGFSLIFKNRKVLNFIISGFLIGLSIILKPILGIFLIGLIYLLIFNYSINKKNIIIAILFSLLLPIIYFNIIYYHFNFYIFPDNGNISKSLTFNYNNFFNNFFVYSGFLYLLTTPLILILNLKIFINFSIKMKIFYSILSLFLFLLGFLYINPGVEMNLGPINLFLNKNIFSGMLSLLAFNLLIILNKIYNLNHSGQYFKLLIILIITYILILSFFLPSQRYLIVLLPIILFLIYGEIKKKIFFYFVTIAYIPLLIVLFINQYNTGLAANKTVSYLIENKIINQTCSSAIEAHSGHYFETFARDCKDMSYWVVNGYKVEDSIFSVKVGYFNFITKSYSVLKIKRE